MNVGNRYGRVPGTNFYVLLVPYLAHEQLPVVVFRLYLYFFDSASLIAISVLRLVVTPSSPLTSGLSCHPFPSHSYKHAHTPDAAVAAGRLEQGPVGMLGDEAGDEGMSRRWGPLVVAALGYVAVGAWDWTDTVEDLARFVAAPYFCLFHCDQP